MIMGEGLVAKSGILLVDYANTLRERGMGRTEALQEAVRVRLRPILMTSCTMIFGMLPLALKLEPGAETRAPMAIVVIGALLSSTLLTLVVVPALYTVVDDVQTRLFHRGRGAPRAEATAVAATTAVQFGNSQPTPSEVLSSSGGQSNGHSNGNGNGNGSQAANGTRGGNGSQVTNGSAARQAVPLNIADEGQAYLVRAALPGIKQEDVHVAIKGRTLTIRGREPDGASTTAWIVREHSPGTWERTLSLPHEVDGSAVTAAYQDGILELQLPKTHADEPERDIPVRHAGEDA